MGFKAFHAGDTGGVRYVIVLADLATGGLIGILDGAHLTAVRTGAVTAVATDAMASADADRFAVIGSGAEAWSNLLAVSRVRRPTRVAVFSPRTSHRDAFAERVRTVLGAEAVAVERPEAVVEGAQIVIAATNTRRLANPIAFTAKMLSPGMHVNSVGSTTPALRELDEHVLLAADRVVFDSIEGSADESGDVKAAIAAGFELSSARELGDVLRAGGLSRRDPLSVTLFKSVGTAVQDVATAEWVLAECRNHGLGTKLDLELFEKAMDL